MNTQATARAYVVFPGEGDQLHALGLTAIEKIRSADTDGVCYAFEVIAPPGFGIPPHVHSREDEVLYVIEGGYEIVLGAERFRAGPGSVLNFTRGTAHGFQCVGDATSRALHVVTPGTSFEQFLHELVQLPPGPPDIPLLVALFGKYVEISKEPFTYGTDKHETATIRGQQCRFVELTPLLAQSS